MTSQATTLKKTSLKAYEENKVTNFFFFFLWMEVQTLESERKKCTWSAKDLAVLLEGSEQRVRQRDAAFNIVLNDPAFQAGDYDQFEKTVPERRVQTLQRMIRFSQVVSGKDEDDEVALIRALSCVDSSTAIKWFVQRLLWIETLKNQGTSEQAAFWTQSARELGIVGCFGMTELGSSSYLRGAETTARYDEATQTFVVHTPTVTGSKIWIGQAGQSATHCIVFANLFVKDKPCGLQLFVVPIRNQKTGEPMPGVELLDMGPRVGLEGNDNGVIIFSNVRIPRENMLARWASVAPDGSFRAAPMEALAYGSTVAERLVSYYYMDRMAVHAAIMWCLLRRQGPPNPLSPQIMDYPTHYPKLMTIIAAQYVKAASGKKNLDRYRSMVQQLRSGDEIGYLKQIAEMHAIACAQKSFVSWSAMDAFETCRRLCGGHAFHQYFTVGRCIADSAVSTTGGGDNNVLVQQTGMFLVKLKPEVAAKSSSTSFLFQAKPLLAPLGPASASLEDLLALFQLRARRSLEEARSAGGKSIPLNIAAAEHWHWALVFANSLEYIGSMASSKSVDPLVLMYRITALDRIINIFADCIVDGSVESSALSLFRKTHQDLALQLRQNALVLVEAFGLPDEILRNPLVSRDGKGYERYVQKMRENRLNKTKVAPYWKELLGPLQKPHLFASKL